MYSSEGRIQSDSEVGDASDGAAGVGAGAGSGSGSGSGVGDAGSGSSVCLADCSWEVRMVSRQVSVS